MTLWNIIRDFFVQNVFGGSLSNGSMVNIGRVGQMFGADGMVGNAGMNNFAVYIGEQKYSGSSILTATHINLGDWLSTTATIITLVLLTAVMYLMVKWIFRVFAGLLR